jgi:transcriptional regulator with XRE-family HTH domain
VGTERKTKTDDIIIDDMTTQWHVGDAIRKLRETAGLTRAKLATMAQLRPNTLGEIEKSGRCNIGTLERIASALGSSLQTVYAMVETKSAEMPPVPCQEHEELFRKLEAILHGKPEWATAIMKAVDGLMTSIQTGPDLLIVPPNGTALVPPTPAVSSPFKARPGDRIRVRRKSR